MPDRYEDNDSRQSAFNLGSLSGARSFANLTIDDDDWFRFNTTAPGTANNELAIDFLHADGDVDLQLLDAQGNVITSSTSVTNRESISLNGVAAGTYYARIYGFSGATNPNYTLSLNAPGNVTDDSYESNNTSQTATNLQTLSSPTLLSGLSLQNDDWFRFAIADTGKAGNSIRLDFLHANGDIDVELLDANGTFIARSNSVNNSEEISLSGLASGSYFVHVYGYAGATNPTYDLTITPPGIQADAYEENDANTTPSNLGTLTGAIAITDLSITDPDWFRFTINNAGTVGNSVRIDFLHANGDVDLGLYDTNGTFLRGSAGVGNSEEISLDGLAAGSYLVQAYGYNNATNPNYTLTITPPGNAEDSFEQNDDRNSAADLGTLVLPYSATGLTLTDDDWFKFVTTSTGTFTDSVGINFRHADGDIDVELVDSNGTVLRFSNGVSDSETISLDGLAAGTYYIRIYGYAGATNPYYDLTIAPPPSPTPSVDAYEPNDTRATAADLRTLSGSNNQFSNLTIHQSNNDDWFRFAIAADGTVGNQASIAFNGELGDIDFELYDQDGVRINGSYGVGNVETVSLDGLLAGTYFLRAYGYSGATNPNYALTIDAPDALPTTIRQDVAEQNDSQAQAYGLRYQGGYYDSSNLNLTMDDSANESAKEDWFKFTLPTTGIAGNKVAIQFQHTLGDLDLAFFDGNGTLIDRSESTTDLESISLDGLTAGDYYIQVYGYAGATNPNYTLIIDGATPGSAIQPDRFEANNSLNAATDLRTLSGTGNGWQNLNINPAGDQDWFKFTTTAAGTLNDFVKIDFNPAAGDLALTLYNANGTQILASNTTTGSELVSLQGLAAGTYYAQVTGVNGATNPDYTLNINAPSTGATLPNWTILVYLDADNDLEAAGVDDINEMEAALLPAGIRVVTLVDRVAGFDSSNGNWTDTRRGLITPDNNQSLISSPLASVGELNMGAPQTLTDFITWGVQNNQAQNYALVLWNHGGGLPGVTWDDTNGGDNLTLTEVTQAVQASNVQFDLIGFDACLQGMVEQGYELRNLTDVLVASQKTEPGDGWDYTAFLNQLAANPNMTAAELGSAIVTTYGAFYGNNETLSATTVGNYSGLKNALNTFANTVLNNATTADWQAIAQARTVAKFFSNQAYRDLKTFTDAIANNNTITAAIRTAAGAVSTAVTTALIRNHSGTNEGGTGLSIYLPAFGSATYSADFTDFYTDTNWLNFLNRQQVTARTASNPDWAEANDVRSQAKDLQRLAGANKRFSELSIDSGNDIDWFRFETVATGGANDTVRIAFETATNGVLKLQLFDASGTLLQTSTSSTNGANTIEQVSLNGLAAGQYFFKAYGLNANTNSYTLTIDAPQSGSIIEDWAERNDQREQAYSLGTIGVEEIRFPGLTMDGTANEATREDWFVINANRGTEWNPNQVAIEFANSQGNLDLYLYDANLNPINPTQGVTDGNGESVSLNDVTQKIYIKVAGRTNAVTNPDYTLVFRGNQSLPNSVPTLQAATFTLAENSPAGTAIGTATATDPEGTALTFAILAGNGDLDGDGTAAFTINATTGAIAVADAGDLNFEQQAQFNLTVRAIDAGGASRDAAIAINLTNVAEPPIARSATFTLAENSANGTIVGRMPFDAEVGSTLSFAIAPSTADSDGDGRLDFGINATGDIFVNDSDAIDFERNPAYSLSVTVQDQGGRTSSATATINLLDVLGERIQGTPNVDRLLGDAGDNIITGGFRNDVITTGAGRDRIVFDIGRSFIRRIGIDQITDFDRQLDKIVLDKTTFKAIKGNRVSFATVRTAAQAQTSNALITFIRGTGAIYYNANGAARGFGSGGQFADLASGIALTAANFAVQA